MQYWVVGAMWGGKREEDQIGVFIANGYWLYGYNPGEQPVQERRLDQIQPGDRIAIKKMLGQGSQEIEIRAIGIVTSVDPQSRRVHVNWVLRDMNRVVPSRGAYETIHSPFAPDDPWTNLVFRI
jgi:hypothetical protein